MSRGSRLNPFLWISIQITAFQVLNNTVLQGYTPTHHVSINRSGRTRNRSSQICFLSESSNTIMELPERTIWWGLKQARVAMETWCHNVKGMVTNTQSKFHVSWLKIVWDMTWFLVWHLCCQYRPFKCFAWMLSQIKNLCDDCHESWSGHYLCQLR